MPPTGIQWFSRTAIITVEGVLLTIGKGYTTNEADELPTPDAITQLLVAPDPCRTALPTVQCSRSSRLPLLGWLGCEGLSYPAIVLVLVPTVILPR